MGKAPTDRPPVADRRMGDVSDRLAQQRRGDTDLGRLQEINVAGQCSDAQDCALQLNPSQLSQTPDIDDQVQ